MYTETISYPSLSEDTVLTILLKGASYFNEYKNLTTKLAIIPLQDGRVISVYHVPHTEGNYFSCHLHQPYGIDEGHVVFPPTFTCKSARELVSTLLFQLGLSPSSKSIGGVHE